MKSKTRRNPSTGKLFYQYSFEIETHIKTLITMTEAQELGRMKRVRNGHRTSTKRTISAANDLLTNVDDKSKLAPH